MNVQVTTIDVAIIGAGWYGLVSARTYLRLRPETNLLILDFDSTVGGVWSQARLYPNLVAQVKHGLFNYSDTPMPGRGRTKNDMVTGQMIHTYLDRYADAHDLHRRIRFRTFVERAERCPRGWRLHLRGTSEVIETEKLMVATGVTSIPSLPDDLNAAQASVPIIHSRDLGASFGALRRDDVQSVVVVGAAKSAYDAVYLLLSMGKKATWIIRPNGAGPLAILPSEIASMNVIAVASTRLMTHLSPSILNIKERFWDFLTYMSHRHAGYADGDHVSALTPEIGGKSVFWANSGLGVVTLPDFWKTMHNGNLTIVRDSLQSLKEDSLLLRSGAAIQLDALVLATGWGDHFAMFDAETKQELGLPSYGKPSCPEDRTPDKAWDAHDQAADRSVNEKLPLLAEAPRLRNPHTSSDKAHRRWRLYRRSIPLQLALKGDRSLAIMGQIHTVQTPLVSEVQSLWSILYLLGELELPDHEVMAREIAEWNAWTRKRYLSQGEKFPYSLYDFLPYIDSLCADLGINTQRKRNPVAEFLSPYKPEDFRGFIDEYLANRARQSNGHVRAEGKRLGLDA